MAKLKPSNVTKLATALTVPNWANSLPGTGAPLDVAGRILRDVVKLDDAAATAIESEAENPDLSVTGIAKARIATGEAKIKALAPLRAEVEKVIGGAISKARAKDTETTPEQAMSRMLRADETRRWLFQAVGDDPLKLELAIREAVDAGDVETVDAILSAPPVWPPSKSFDHAALTEQRNGMIDQNLGPEIVVLAQAEKDLTDRLDWAEQRIRKADGISSEGDGIDKIATAATGA